MILTFKPQFVEPIKDGTKIHPIRKDKTGRWKPGMKIQFWSGNPRNVKANPHQFQSGVCTDVAQIIIDFNHNDVLIVPDTNFKTKLLTGITKLDEFARNDGFEDWDDLKKWFENQYGDKHFFGGTLIYFKVHATR